MFHKQDYNLFYYYLVIEDNSKKKIKELTIRKNKENIELLEIQDYDFHRVIEENVILVALYEFQMEVYNDDFEN